MKWKKLGKIFDINNINDERIRSHCMTPVAMQIENDIYRIYLNSRDDNGYSVPIFLEININNPFEILAINTKPIIDLGPKGSFDECGVVLTSYLKKNNEIWFYYSGFPHHAKKLFYASIGLAISSDNGLTTKKPYGGPILSCSKDEPYFATGPRIFSYGDKYLLFYTSCHGWKEENCFFKHYYNIKCRKSENGIDFGERIEAISFKNDDEYAISIPSIIKDGDNDYKMWYTFRAQPKIETYRIGYAVSKDGINWIRKDELMKHFDVSEYGWDSEMICFPYVFDHKGKRYMLYNGNDYGNSGVGLAVLETNIED